MTFSEIRQINAEFLLATDISPLINWDANAIRIVAKSSPDEFAFPVIVIGKRIKIPRVAFLKCFDELVENRKEVT